MTVQCCKCKKVKYKTDWVAVAGTLSGGVSHGFCPACLEETRAEFTAEARAIARARRERPRWAEKRPAVGYSC